MSAIGGHQSARAQTDCWLTPLHVTDALRRFDLDPCTTAENWIGADAFYSDELGHDGLTEQWAGSVWCNPPYSNIAAWMRKMADHNNGIALVFARTETRWWHESIWPHASSITFLAGRLTFHRRDGSLPKANSGGPHALIAYGSDASHRLAASDLPGAFVDGRRFQP